MSSSLMAAVAPAISPSSLPIEETLELTVLMPCLNEAETLRQCVLKARSCIERIGIAAEVLVADNGSTDGSQRIAIEAGARVVPVSERGYGAALYHGVQAARGRFIIMGDADDSYDFSSLDRFVEKLRDGYDLVMGDRFGGGIAPGAMPWKNRYIGNPGLSSIGQLFFRCPVKDFHCGIRGFSRTAFDRMRLQTTGMEFASELVIKATLLDMRITEVPTTLSKDGRNRPPHLRPWRDGWRHLRFMLLYSPRWLFLYPGALLMAIGLAVGAALLPGPIMLSPTVGLDVHTLLFAFAAVLVGFQAVAFAVFTRIYAYNEGLLPHDETLERLFKTFTLEIGLGVGIVLLLLGFGGTLSAIFRWSAVGFGPLNARDTLRTAIPSAAAICLGGQVVLTSFLLSFLGLKKR
ncbi:MAG TPA: glycosyltransferase family 2 protein [Vicinamibacterales bacterium]|nr:glycosyltransferase family 2 protein [Vicinamibacterales bacterium]